MQQQPGERSTHKDSRDELPLSFRNWDVLVVDEGGLHPEATAANSGALAVLVLDSELEAAELDSSSRDALWIVQVPPLADPEPEALPCGDGAEGVDKVRLGFVCCGES